MKLMILIILSFPAMAELDICEKSYSELAAEGAVKHKEILAKKDAALKAINCPQKPADKDGEILLCNQAKMHKIETQAQQALTKVVNDYQQLLDRHNKSCGKGGVVTTTSTTIIATTTSMPTVTVPPANCDDRPENHICDWDATKFQQFSHCVSPNEKEVRRACDEQKN